MPWLERIPPLNEGRKAEITFKECRIKFRVQHSWSLKKISKTLNLETEKHTENVWRVYLILGMSPLPSPHFRIQFFLFSLQELQFNAIVQYKSNCVLHPFKLKRFKRRLRISSDLPMIFFILHFHVSLSLLTWEREGHSWRLNVGIDDSDCYSLEKGRKGSLLWHPWPSRSYPPLYFTSSSLSRGHSPLPLLCVMNKVLDTVLSSGWHYFKWERETIKGRIETVFHEFVFLIATISHSQLFSPSRSKCAESTWITHFILLSFSLSFDMQ